GRLSRRPEAPGVGAGEGYPGRRLDGRVETRGVAREGRQRHVWREDGRGGGGVVRDGRRDGAARPSQEEAGARDRRRVHRGREDGGRCDRRGDPGRRVLRGRRSHGRRRGRVLRRELPGDGSGEGNAVRGLDRRVEPGGGGGVVGEGGRGGERR